MRQLAWLTARGEILTQDFLPGLEGGGGGGEGELRGGRRGGGERRAGSWGVPGRPPRVVCGFPFGLWEAARPHAFASS